MYYVYVLYSKVLDRYYVGHTDDLDFRLRRHNTGMVRSTKSGMPWELKYFEEYQSRSEAIIRERAIKRKKSRRYIEFLIGE